MRVPPPVSKSLLKPSAQEVEWEVLPPEQTQPRSSLESVFRFVAVLMDRLIQIPGIKKRLGLNPIVDLIPGFGDIAAGVVSVSVLAYAVRRGVPKVLLGRMALNVLINEVVGIIPIAGSIFAFWFTANTRNYELLRQHLDVPHRSTKSDKIFVGAILSLVIVIIVVGIVATFFIMREIAKVISGA